MPSDVFDMEELHQSNSCDVLISGNDPMLPPWTDSKVCETSCRNVKYWFDVSSSDAGELLFRPKSTDFANYDHLTGATCFTEKRSPVPATLPPTCSPQQPVLSSTVDVSSRFCSAAAIGQFVSINPPLKQRGRPVKITSHSKQAMYARAYRNRHKEQLLAYERRIAEHEKVIKALSEERDALRGKLYALNEDFENLKAFVSNEALFASSRVIIDCIINGRSSLYGGLNHSASLFSSA